MTESKTLNKSGINWAELYFTAEADKEEYKDVRIVTAKSAYLDVLQEEALDRHPKFLSGNGPVTNADLRAFAEEFAKDFHHYVRESVTFEEDQILIIIDADVIDDDSTDRALEMLAAAVSQAKDVVFFSACLSYPTHALPWPKD